MARSRLISFQLLGLSAIVLAATAPFLGKAFHVDDSLYLAVARQILRKPWDPYGSELLWEEEPESLFDADFNPPLWSYCIAGVLSMTGEPQVTVLRAGQDDGERNDWIAQTPKTPEVGLHLLSSALVAAAIVALYLLARRFVRWPLCATALVALSPAMLPGQNVMLEGPLMAFWLWATWCYLRAIDTDASRWTWATGILAVLGVLTKYTSGLVLVILALHAVLRRRWRTLWFLLPPVLALMLWSLHNAIVYDRLHVLVIFSRVQTGAREGHGVELYETWGRLLATCRAIGAVTALALPMLWMIWRRHRFWAALGLATCSLAVGWLGKWDMSERLRTRGVQLEDAVAQSLVAKHSGCLHAIGFGALGACTLLGLALTAKPTHVPRSDPTQSWCDSDSEETLLWLWLASVLLFGLLAVPFLAVRHLLPGIPPLVMLVLRRLEQTSLTRFSPATGWVLGCTTLLTAGAGFLVAKADYDFARWYRHVAVDVGARSVAMGRELGRKVWFTGHWGWAYYAQRAGMSPYVAGRTVLRDGDLLLLPLIQTWELPAELVDLDTMVHIKPKAQPLKEGHKVQELLLDWCLSSVRTISTETHYYGGGTVNLPWRFSRKPLDDFLVTQFRVRSQGTEVSGQR